jgi:hypothetical protein
MTQIFNIILDDAQSVNPEISLSHLGCELDGVLNCFRKRHPIKTVDLSKPKKVLIRQPSLDLLFVRLAAGSPNVTESDVAALSRQIHNPTLLNIDSSEWVKPGIIASGKPGRVATLISMLFLALVEPALDKRNVQELANLPARPLR